MFKTKELQPHELPFGSRSRTDLSLAHFPSESSLAVKKTYHQPKLRAVIRRHLIASLIDQDYMPMTPEENIKHEVARLRKFAEQGILVPEILSVTERSYTMKLIPHASAEEHLQQGQTEVVDHVLIALKELHRKDLTHGDFFPANIIPIDDKRSVILDPGMRYADQDTLTGRFRDLTQALFRIGHFIPEMTPVIKALANIYQNPEELSRYYQYVKQTSISQRFITDVVFKDYGIFNRVLTAMKTVFGKDSRKHYF